MTKGLVRHGNRVDLIIAKVMLELVDLMSDDRLGGPKTLDFLRNIVPAD